MKQKAFFSIASFFPLIVSFTSISLAEAADQALRKPVAATAAMAGAVTDDLKIGGIGPQLVVVPAGEFLMGSPADEPGRYADESPQHPVRFAKAFALGRTEVTVGEFKKFVEATKYRTTAEQEGGSWIRDPANGVWKLKDNLNWNYDNFGNPTKDEHPVVHISWEDAQSYLKWLSEQTGKKYRLPSEAELEYANRAGTTTRYWWGNEFPTAKVGNLRGEKDMPLFPAPLRFPTKEEFSYAFEDGYTKANFTGYGDGFGGVSPVASFKTNPFGLYDTSGNVWEWTEDCWHDSYENAPADGSAWIVGKGANCGRRVLRGGSFYCYPRHVRAANRWSEVPAFRNMYVGFRVARDLD